MHPLADIWIFLNHFFDVTRVRYSIVLELYFWQITRQYSTKSTYFLFLISLRYYIFVFCKFYEYVMVLIKTIFNTLFSQQPVWRHKHCFVFIFLVLVNFGLQNDLFRGTDYVADDVFYLFNSHVDVILGNVLVQN